MKGILKKNIEKSFWVLMLIFFIFTRGFNLFSNIRFFLVMLGSLRYIIYYVCKVRTDKYAKWLIKIKRFGLDFLLLIPCITLVEFLYQFNILDLKDKVILDDFLLTFFGLFLLIRILLLSLSIRFRELVILIIVVYVIGYIKPEWWTGISLLSALVTVLYSEDIMIFFVPEEIKKDQLPYSLKIKFMRGRIILLVSNVIIYFSLIISKELSDKGVVERLALEMNKNKIEGSDYKIPTSDMILSLSIIRIILLAIFAFFAIVLYRKVIKSYIRRIIDKENIVMKSD